MSENLILSKALSFVRLTLSEIRILSRALDLERYASSLKNKRKSDVALSFVRLALGEN